MVFDRVRREQAVGRVDAKSLEVTTIIYIITSSEDYFDY